jgi:hypothetical protein
LGCMLALARRAAYVRSSTVQLGSVFCIGTGTGGQ